MKVKNKINPICKTLLFLGGGGALGVAVSLLYTSNLTVPKESVLAYPSEYSSEYLNIVGDHISNEETEFVVLNNEGKYVSLDSPFVKSLQNFSEKYINTLTSDVPKYKLSDFYLPKDEETYGLIEEDLKVNEPLYMIDKDYIKVVKKNEGYISPDGNNAALKVVFEFKVNKVITHNDLTSSIEEGSVYTQERELSLKRTATGDFKIYETFIGPAEKVE